MTDKQPYYERYAEDYKTSSRVLTSVLYQILIIFALMLVFVFLCRTELVLDWVFITLYLVSSFVFTFASGVLILKTMVTRVPIEKTWHVSSIVNSLFLDNFRSIARTQTGNKWVDYIFIFPLIGLPLYIVNIIGLIIFNILRVIFIVFVAYIHALFLFVPAYYIDAHRRKLM